MRRKNDFYPTAVDVTAVLPQYVPLYGHVGEVCAGQMDMANVLRGVSSVSRVWTNDITPYPGLDFVSDATKSGSAVWQRPYGWVVTNPPFNVAYDVLRQAWDHTSVGVAMLLRLSFLEPVGGRYEDEGDEEPCFFWPDNGRGEWLKANENDLSHLIIFGSPRPSFTGNGRTDSTTVAWMVWQHGHRHRAIGSKIIFSPGWRRTPPGKEL